MRNGFKKVRRSGPKTDPLRIDPSKTGGIRRRFEAALRLRIQRVWSQLWYLMDQDDALGMRDKPYTLNVFCPTGEGGGIDPTCSPGESFADDDLSGRNLVQRAADHYSEQLKDSVIKTKAGNPIPVYHGTDKDFKDFKGEAIYFSPDPRYGYVTQSQHKHVAFLDLKNPYRTEDHTEAERIGYHPEEIERLKSLGYDGLVYSKKTDLLKGASGWGDDMPQYVVFDPKQIKRIGKYDADDLQWLIERGDLTNNVEQSWRFGTSEQKLNQFTDWLRQLFKKELTGADDRMLWTRFVTDAFRKGMSRSMDDYLKAKPDTKETKDGQRQEFLRSAFSRPVAIEKVQLLASRTFTDLQGVTDATATQMTRVLADGLARGDSPRVVAVRLGKVMEDTTLARALTIARTETIRAHAEGQLVALEQLGAKQLNVDVEWSTAGDGKVCQLCKPLQGLIVPIEKAIGMLPRHPNCRCAWKPHVPLPDGFKRVNGRIVVANARVMRTIDRVYQILVGNDRSCGIAKGGFQKGNTCAKGGTGTKNTPEGKGKKVSLVASPAELKEAQAKASQKVKDAPVPPKEKVAKNRKMLADCNAYFTKERAMKAAGKSPKDIKKALGAPPRAGGDMRGSSFDRKRRAQQLFKEFGGEEKGYVVCHGTGLKMHWADPKDKKNNPKGYPKFEQGKIFTAFQGGGYQVPNLLPESFAHNRSRNDETVRKENLK